MFFEAIVEARAMMARPQAIGSVASATTNGKRHDSRLEAARRL
jgi:hypothetical protein